MAQHPWIGLPYAVGCYDISQLGKRAGYLGEYTTELFRLADGY